MLSVRGEGRQACVCLVFMGRFSNHKLYHLPRAGLSEGKREGPGIWDINTNGDPSEGKAASPTLSLQQ